jgi:hypothetical protein
MLTEDEIKKEIERLTAEMQACANEHNYCTERARNMASKVTYISGKVDALKGLIVNKNKEDTPIKSGE